MHPRRFRPIHQIVVGCALALTAILAVEALLAIDGGLNIRLFDDSKNRWSMTLREGRDFVKVKSRGPVELADDPATPTPILPAAGAHFEVDARQMDVRRHLDVRLGENGAPLYDYALEGKSHPFDDAARLWLRDIVLDCFRSGLDAEARAARLYRDGGVAAVTAELEAIDSDEVARRYLQAIFELPDELPDELPKVPDTDLRLLLDASAAGLGSDQSQLEVLTHFDPQRLAENGVAQAYFRAAETLGSDYAQRQALEHAFDAPLDDDSWSRLFDVATAIGSDHEASELLIHYADHYAELGRPNLPTSLDTLLATIGGDYDQRRAAAAVAGSVAGSVAGDAAAEQQARILGAVDIGSDHDMAELLIFLANQAGSVVDVPEVLRVAALEAASSIGSQSERERVNEAWQFGTRLGEPGEAQIEQDEDRVEQPADDQDETLDDQISKEQTEPE